MTTPTIVDKIEALHERLERARIIVADGKVSPVLGMDEHFTIASSTGDGSYLVNAACTCPDANDPRRKDLIRGICKHRLAAILYMEATTNEGSEHDGNNHANDEGNADDKPTSRRGAKSDNGTGK